jgi:apolipoprotein D and lipocalin family protein
MKFPLLLAASTAFVMALASCASRSPHAQPPTTVASVDLARYTGSWYEIASKPMIFQRGCEGTTAVYTAQANGSIMVENTCRKKDGTTAIVVGRAKVVPETGNAKLKVNFFGPFWGDYWVLALDEKDYRYALIGGPDRRYLWILSRTRTMDQTTLTKLTSIAQAQGYDLSDLSLTVQP